MTQIPTIESHLGVSSGTHGMRHDFASSITGPRTRWWQFKGDVTPPSWVQSVGVLPTDLWMLVWWKLLPGSAKCGRIIDGHSEVTDTDIQDHAAQPGAGVSAFAIDHNVGSDSFGSWSGLHLVLEAEGDDHGNKYHWTIIPDSSIVAGQRYRLKIRLRLGRRGSSSPGIVQIWALDFDAVNPVVDLSGVSTIWANQSVMHFLQGPYNFGSSSPAVCQMGATRFGLTESDAYADGVARVISDTGDVAGAGPNDFDLAVSPPWDTIDFGQPGGGGGGGGSGGTGTAGKTAVGASWRAIGQGIKFVEKKITVPAGKYWRIDDLKAYIRGSQTVAGTENLKPIVASDSGGVPSLIKAIGLPSSSVGAVGGGVPTVVSRGTPNAGVSNSLDFSLPAGVAAGDLCHFHGFFRSNIIPTTPSGWTAKVSAFDGGTSKVYLFEKVLTSGDISAGKITINTNFSAYFGGYIVAYRGASGSEAVTTSTDNNTSIDPASVTTLGTNRLVINYLDVAGTGRTIAPPSGWSEPFGEYDSGAEVLDVITISAPTAGGYDAGAMTITAAAWSAIGVALTPSGGGSADAAAWKTFDLGLPVLSSGDYWVGFITNGTDLAAELAYDAGAAGSTQKNTDAGYNTIAIGGSFGGSLTGTTDVASMYVDYTEVAAPAGGQTESWNNVPI